MALLTLYIGVGHVPLPFDSIADAQVFLGELEAAYTQIQLTDEAGRAGSALKAIAESKLPAQIPANEYTTEQHRAAGELEQKLNRDFLRSVPLSHNHPAFALITSFHNQWRFPIKSKADMLLALKIAGGDERYFQNQPNFSIQIAALTSLAQAGSTQAALADAHEKFQQEISGKLRAVFHQLQETKAAGGRLELKFNDAVATAATERSLRMWSKLRGQYSKQQRKKLWQLRSTAIMLVAVAIGLYALIDLPTGPAGDASAFQSWAIDNSRLLIPSLTVLSIGAWILRNLNRQYYAFAHLTRVCEEKVSQIATYRSLVKADMLPKEHWPLVFASIFREISDGLVEDGSQPVIPLDYLAAVRSSS